VTNVLRFLAYFYRETSWKVNIWNTERSITDWNQLPEWAIGTSHGKTHIFKTRVRKVPNSGGSEGDKK